MAETPIIVQGEDPGKIIKPDSKEFERLLSLPETELAEHAHGKIPADLERRVTAFPELWSPERRWVMGFKGFDYYGDGGEIVRNLSDVPGLEEVGQDLEYVLEIRPFGKGDFPGVGKLRSACVIQPKNTETIQTLVFMYPGFKHTHRYFNNTWYLHYLAQIAKQKNAAVIMIDPEGRGVPGFEDALGVSRMSPDQIYKDTLHITEKKIEEYRHLTSDRVLDVITMGHSMGAKLARLVAYALFKKQQEYEGNAPFQLRGIVMDAPRAASRFADIRTWTYIKAILAHVPESVSKSCQNEKGCELKVRDILRLFLNETTLENLYLSIQGMNVSSWKYFLCETLGKGDIDEFQKTLRECETMKEENGGIGASLIRHGEDRIFSPRATRNMLHPRHMGDLKDSNHVGAKPLYIQHMAHCHSPIPTERELRETLSALQEALHVVLEKPETKVFSP